MARGGKSAAFIRANIEGIAPYAPGKRASEMRRELGLEKLVKLSSNESALPPFPKASAAVRAMSGSVNRYPDSYSTVLRERVAEHLGVAPGRVCLGNGSNELITLIAQCILRPGDQVVCGWPSFVVYPIVAQLMEAELLKVPLTEDWRYDLAAMAEAIGAKTRIVFVCNPNNPTGTMVRADELEAFMGRVPKTCLVVFDEAYFEYVEDRDFGCGMPYFDGRRRVVVLRTFSKMYGLAGLRVGYGAFPDELAAAIEKVREPFNVNIVAQIAAYHSLGDEAEVLRRKELAGRMRRMIYDTCDEIGVRHASSQANFVAIEVPDGPKAFLALARRGVIVRGFGETPMLRVTVGTKEETRLFCDALAAIAEDGWSGLDG